MLTVTFNKSSYQLLHVYYVLLSKLHVSCVSPPLIFAEILCRTWIALSLFFFSVKKSKALAMKQRVTQPQDLSEDPSSISPRHQVA